jgi:phosphatidate cytidylyltransferase
MKKRILTAAVALPILISAIVLPVYIPDTVWLFVVLAALAIAAGMFEFYSLAKRLQLKADAAVGYIAAAVLFTAFSFDLPAQGPDLLVATIALVLILVLITQMFRFQADFSKMLTGLGVTFFGVMYVAFLGGFLVAVRVGFGANASLSTDLLGYFFLVMFGSDTGAYFVGRSLGKHKLAPKMSPSKTVEGLVGGIVTAVGLAALSSYWFFEELPLAVSMALAAVLAFIGVLGDLAESAMKRGSNTKDAANTLPGHGGLLDRLDSLLFGAPVLYYFARFYF